jgi:hypothetical protein
VTAKRAIWLFRGVLYPVAAIVVPAWLLHRGDARLSGGGIRGTFDSVVDVMAPFHGTCRSGPVTFSAAQ